MAIAGGGFNLSDLVAARHRAEEGPANTDDANVNIGKDAQEKFL
jgi:hypothetical protein